MDIQSGNECNSLPRGVAGAGGAERRAPHAAAGPARYCSPRHRLPNYTGEEVCKYPSMSWRAVGLVNIARHARGCHLSREMKGQMRDDEVAGSGPGRYRLEGHVMSFNYRNEGLNACC